MTAHWIDITADGFSGYLSLPPTGRGPGIVLLQEIWGVNEHIRAVADQYAQDGYVVLAPDLFWRLERRVDLAYDEAGSARARQLLQTVDGAQAAADVAAAVGLLRARPEVTGRVATLGYCFGGQMAFRAAALAQADAAVCYYGGGIAGHLALAPRLDMPILFHHAALDTLIPPDAVAAIKAAFSDQGKAVFLDYPGVGHGFNCWGRPSYAQKAAALAHGLTLEFLSQHL